MKPRFEQPPAAAGTTFASYIRRESAFGFGWHHHREYELTLITRGSGTRYVGTTVECYRRGDLVLLGPDLPHTFTSEPYEGVAEAAVTQFRHDFLGPDFFAFPQFRTLTDHLNQLRVETACALLTGTTLPVTEMAARSGYRNLSNFNRRFRELKGLRPTEYRAAHLRRAVE